MNFEMEKVAEKITKIFSFQWQKEKFSVVINQTYDGEHHGENKLIISCFIFPPA